MTSLSSLTKVKPRQCKQYVTDCIRAGLVPFLQSSPGVGKSAINHLIANENNLKMIDHRLSTSAPEDLSGLPRFDENGFARFAPFADLFPLEGTPLPRKTAPEYDDKGNVIKEATYYDGWMLFLDEFNSASKSVQAAAYKLVLDRMVGQHRLHERCVIVAAGNLATDRAIVNPLSTAMQSRVIHIELEHDFEQWLMDVALKQNYDSRIIAYLSQNPSKLMDFRPEHQERTFCCPRTWEFMQRLIKNQEVNEDRATLFGGTITTLVATEFVQFCKIFADVINIREVLADPENCRLPTDISSRWACISHLSELMDAKTFGDVATYVSRFSLDFQVLFFRSTMVRHPDLRSHPAFQASMSKMAKYLYGN